MVLIMFFVCTVCEDLLSTYDSSDVLHAASLKKAFAGSGPLTGERNAVHNRLLLMNKTLCIISHCCNSITQVIKSVSVDVKITKHFSLSVI